MIGIFTSIFFHAKEVLARPTVDEADVYFSQVGFLSGNIFIVYRYGIYR